MLRQAGLPLLAALAVASCGGEDTQSSTGATATTGTSGENHAPAWVDAPAAAVAMGQGQTRALPLTLEDVDGDTPTASVTPPAGLEVEIGPDATGALQLAVHADYAVSGPLAFEVILDDGKVQATVRVDVTVAPIRWLPRQTWTEPDGPEAREHASVIVDTAGGQAFVFGGSSYSPQLEPLNDAWRYDIASGAWSKITPTGDVPPPGGSRRVAQAPGTTVAYLWGGYGGVNAGTNFDDLYRVTVAGQNLAFQAITQNGTPPERALHVFAYDAWSERFVLFGGAGAGTKPLADTWTMTLAGDVATWTEITPATSPSGRYGSFSGVDAERSRVIVYSGAQGFASINAAQDVWALDMRAEPPVWELLIEGAAAGVPTGRRNGCGVFDPSGPRLFVFGGTADGMVSEDGLFVFDVRPGKAAWTPLALADEIPVRSSGFGFHDEAGGRTLMGFGNSTSAYRDWGILGY